MATHWTKTGDFYVDGINGSDSNAGTPGAPVKTINKGVDLVEAAGSGNASLVVGTGIYNEMVTAGTTTDYISLYADGDVYIDGTGLDACIFNGYYWHYYDFKFINAYSLWDGDNTARYPNFTRCHFKDLNNMYRDVSIYTISSMTRNLTSCIFENVRSLNLTSAYSRYWVFDSCIFHNCTLFENSGNIGSTNSYGGQFQKCLISGDSGSCIGYSRAIASHGYIDCIFQNNLKMYWYGYGTPANGTADITEDNVNVDGIYMRGNQILSMSFNENVSGSSGLTILNATMPLNVTNSEIWKQTNFNPAFGFVGNAGPRTTYGYDNSASNPLHTAGGATWDNIITSSIGGFQISSSVDNNTTASITTAVIDQGSSKIVKNISYNWATSVPNACAITVYTASVLNENPVRYTYEMRYGESSPSGDYKIFSFNSTPFVDSNGSGSGDIEFNTGSYDRFSARYLQMRFTLRTNLSGSL